MRWSWRAGCPVPLSNLRYLTLAYVGFDGRTHSGELVVHRDAVADVTAALRALYEADFPIRQMRLVDDYRGNDRVSMAADNSSAFNCRPSTGSPNTWSQHSYGRAIDLNPVENPYLSGRGGVQPAAGAPFVDRRRARPGMILPGGRIIRSFAAVGWSWGGGWRGTKDLQHFSANGK